MCALCESDPGQLINGLPVCVCVCTLCDPDPGQLINGLSVCVCVYSV